MPDIDEIIEILRRNADDARERIRHILEEEGVQELPFRMYDSFADTINAVFNSITAGGTLPGLPALPTSGHSRQTPAPPPVPLTVWEKLLKHIRARPYIYSALAGTSFALFGTFVGVHVSPAFRTRLFSAIPLLKPIYLKQRRALPATPRPRLSVDGKYRLEAVVVLGCDAGSYGREVAKALERKGFVVIASVSNIAEVDELEFAGGGYIKAIVLSTAKDHASIPTFIRSLNTALSLRYPLNSAGDPFQYISQSNPGMQLMSVVNCLPLERIKDSPALPLEALPTNAISQQLEVTVTTSILLLQSLIPILRVAHDPSGLPATIITCTRAPERFVGVPFSGLTSAVPGIASNALVSSLDVLRREVNCVNSRSRRNVRIVNVDVGFLQPVNTRKSHRGVSKSPDSKAPSPELKTVEKSLPPHLRDIYAPALLAHMDHNASTSRTRLPDASVLSDRVLSIILARKARHIPDRSSVGVGMNMYYLATLLPIRLVDAFFSLRNRLLAGVTNRTNSSTSSNGQTMGESSLPLSQARRPLPLPGQPKAAEAMQEQAYSVDLNNDTILPPYAPSAEGSTLSSTWPSQSTSPTGEHSRTLSEHSSGPSVLQSGFLGESFVQV